MSIPSIHAALAEVLRGVAGVNQVHYPAPNSLAGTQQVVVYAGTFEATQGMGQVYLIGESQAILYIAPTSVPQAVSEADGMVYPIMDAFAAGTPGFTLGHTVDHCHVVRVELSQTYIYAEQQYYGARFTFALKIRRFPGGA